VTNTLADKRDQKWILIAATATSATPAGGEDAEDAGDRQRQQEEMTEPRPRQPRRRNHVSVPHQASDGTNRLLLKGRLVTDCLPRYRDQTSTPRLTLECPLMADCCRTQADDSSRLNVSFRWESGR